MHEVICGLHYRNAIDIEQLFNYPSENDVVMESPTDEEIIWGIIYTSVYDDHYPDDGCILLGFSTKEAFQVIICVKNYSIQHENNILNVMHAPQKINIITCIF